MATRFFYGGDRDRAVQYRGAAAVFLDSFKHALSFQKLYSGRTQRRLQDGTVFDVRVVGNDASIAIYAPVRQGVIGENKKPLTILFPQIILLFGAGDLSPSSPGMKDIDSLAVSVSLVFNTQTRSYKCDTKKYKMIEFYPDGTSAPTDRILTCHTPIDTLYRWVGIPELFFVFPGTMKDASEVIPGFERMFADRIQQSEQQVIAEYTPNMTSAGRRVIYALNNSRWEPPRSALIRHEQLPDIETISTGVQQFYDEIIIGTSGFVGVEGTYYRQPFGFMEHESKRTPVRVFTLDAASTKFNIDMAWPPLRLLKYCSAGNLETRNIIYQDPAVEYAEEGGNNVNYIYSRYLSFTGEAVYSDHIITREHNKMCRTFSLPWYTAKNLFPHTAVACANPDVGVTDEELAATPFPDVPSDGRYMSDRGITAVTSYTMETYEEIRVQCAPEIYTGTYWTNGRKDVFQWRIATRVITRRLKIYDINYSLTYNGVEIDQETPLFPPFEFESTQRKRFKTLVLQETFIGPYEASPPDSWDFTTTTEYEQTCSLGKFIPSYNQDGQSIHDRIFIDLIQPYTWFRGSVLSNLYGSEAEPRSARAALFFLKILFEIHPSNYLKFYEDDLVTPKVHAVNKVKIFIYGSGEQRTWGNDAGGTANGETTDYPLFLKPHHIFDLNNDFCVKLDAEEIIEAFGAFETTPPALPLTERLFCLGAFYKETDTKLST